MVQNSQPLSPQRILCLSVGNLWKLILDGFFNIPLILSNTSGNIFIFTPQHESATKDTLRNARRHFVNLDVVLQFINNDVPRFSHLTYHTEVPMWNVLRKKYLNNFDIEIRDHKGHLFPRSAIADFVMVLMFEVVHEINENIDDVVAYQAQAYREGHPTSSGT